MRQMKTRGYRDTTAKQHAEGSADEDGDRQPPGSGFECAERDARVDEPEEKQRDLPRMSPRDLESTQGVDGVGRRIDEKPGVAGRVGQERHDRHQRERWMETTPP